MRWEALPASRCSLIMWWLPKHAQTHTHATQCINVRSLQGYNNAQGNDAILRNKYMHGNYPVPPTSAYSGSLLRYIQCKQEQPGGGLTCRTSTAATC